VTATPPDPTAGSEPAATAESARSAARRRQHVFRGLDAELVVKLEEAIKLKDYAIRNNYQISDHTIMALNQLADEVRVHFESADSGANAAKQPLELGENINFAAEAGLQRGGEDLMTRVDTILRDLIQLTYPASLELALSASAPSSGTRPTSQVALGRAQLRSLWGVLGLCASLGIAVAIGSFGLGQGGPLWYSLIGASLGMLGSSVFLLVSLSELRSRRALVEADRQSAWTRLLLGPLVGWVFFFVFAQSAFATKPSDLTGAQTLLLFAPFLARFSTRFVVGIITKALQAAEFTFGINDVGMPRRRGGGGSGPRDPSLL